MCLDYSTLTVLNNLIKNRKNEEVFILKAAQRELCTVSTPMNILGDVFDLLPLAKCEIFFKIVELEVNLSYFSMHE